ESDGLLVVEAENFAEQTKDEVRRWYRFDADDQPELKPDPDPPHLEGAGGGAYLEILPDTRANHGETLVWAENFMNDPGRMAILTYPVLIETPGRYYVWARIYSTGTEDNGLHVGLNGTWPESGRRLQWTAKQQWKWNSKQRTAQQHGGVRGLIWLDIDQPGYHEISFSMREDGTEFDRWLITTDPNFAEPDGVGPDESPMADIPDDVVDHSTPKVEPRGEDGTGDVSLSTDPTQWETVTLTLDGPWARESGDDFNPFTDARLDVTFTHESGDFTYVVPGYFAADGNAAETSATAGTSWRAHLLPDVPGSWSYEVSFWKDNAPLKPFDGVSGSFDVADGKDSVHGRLEYVGERYLRFAGSGAYFLQAGADAPETLLAFEDFDGTVANKPGVPLKTWAPHVDDWNDGDPTWQGGKGKGLIGAVNYLAGTGCNAFSFLTYNAGGDGDNVWPFVRRDASFAYDCSKLDQWGIVFQHAASLGMHLHFKLQETENDDQRPGNQPTALDGGALGPERKLYLREMVARFGHLPALNWNLGEESTQTPAEQRAMALYLAKIDPYQHPRVIHSYPNQQEKVYTPLLGEMSELTGASLQNNWRASHKATLRWVKASAGAGKPWVCANDEQGPANFGVPADAEFGGKTIDYTPHDIRRWTLWGNLMAGGAGVEYYFGYQLPENDLNAENWRSRASSWTFAANALRFFKDNDVPFWKMDPADELVEAPATVWCLAGADAIVVYMHDATQGPAVLDLTNSTGTYTVRWFDTVEGGELITGSVETVNAGVKVKLGTPPTEREGNAGHDWAILLTR
ncbi:MAG: DUF5060 domain-containing protein, partial [Planctomycetota bacterium]